MFSDLYRLRNIRLSDNKFNCDCKLEWLYQQWLPRIPRLGSSTQCHGPENMAGLPLADMHKHHMQCGNYYTLIHLNITIIALNNYELIVYTKTKITLKQKTLIVIFA